MEETTTTPRSKELTVGKKICVVLAAVYAPYVILFITLEWGWLLLMMWAIYPGLAIRTVWFYVSDVLGLNLRLSGGAVGIVLTGIFLAATFFIASKARKNFWLIIWVVFLISIGMVGIISVLMKGGPN